MRCSPPGDAWAWNQAMMDLGARLCRPRPDCASCPFDTLVRVVARRARRSPTRPSAPPMSAAASRPSPARIARVGAGSSTALRRGPICAGDLPGVMGWPGDPERAERVTATLVADGLSSSTLTAASAWRERPSAGQAAHHVDDDVGPGLGVDADPADRRRR